MRANFTISLASFITSITHIHRPTLRARARSENSATASLSLTAGLRCALSTLLVLVIGGRLLQEHARHRIIVQHLLVFVCHILRCFREGFGSSLRLSSFLSALLGEGFGLVSLAPLFLSDGLGLGCDSCRFFGLRPLFLSLKRGFGCDSGSFLCLESLLLCLGLCFNTSLLGSFSFFTLTSSVLLCFQSCAFGSFSL